MEGKRNISFFKKNMYQYNVMNLINYESQGWFAAIVYNFLLDKCDWTPKEFVSGA